jgi:hypothetical protein
MLKDELSAILPSRGHCADGIMTTVMVVEERRCRVAALERIDRHVEQRQVIGHEERVELAALQRLRKALQIPEVEIGVGEGARIALGPGVDARRPHERAELELT